MNRTLFCLATLSIFAGGCGRAALTAEPASATARAEARTTADTNADVNAEAASAESPRQPGDFVVYRFSGSFRKDPLTLTERVISRTADALTVDVTADDGKTKRELRVKMSDTVAHRNEVLSVAKLENGKVTPTTIDAFEQLLASATLSADSNDAVLGSEDVKVTVGKTAMDAKRTSFRVRVGKKHGTLKTLESTTFAWGDLGGEITTDAGKVLYKAEVVDAGHADPAAPPAAAIATDD